jgi:hypothetical protein
MIEKLRSSPLLEHQHRDLQNRIPTGYRGTNETLFRVSITMGNDQNDELEIHRYFRKNRKSYFVIDGCPREPLREVSLSDGNRTGNFLFIRTHGEGIGSCIRCSLSMSAEVSTCILPSSTGIKKEIY